MNSGLINLSQPHNYVSEEQQAVASTAFTFALPIASTPDVVRVVGVCRIAEEGYVIGDEIDSPGLTSIGTASHIVIVAAAGVVTVITGALLSTQNKSSAARANLTYANWKLKVYAGWLSPFA